MSFILNMVGGTTGGGSFSSTDAVLRVEAPAHSTVTITKSATTITGDERSNSVNPDLSDYYFIIPQSQFDSTPWVVSASLGTWNTSGQIVINNAQSYNVLFSMRVYLYNEGDQCTSLTGGWDRVTTYGTLNLGASEMDYKSGNDGTERFVSTVNAIDVTYFDTIYFSARCNSSSAKRVGVASTKGGTMEASVSLEKGTDYHIYSVDVSSLSGIYFVEFSNASSPTPTYVNIVYAE